MPNAKAMAKFFPAAFLEVWADCSCLRPCPVFLFHACRTRILLREGVEAPAFVKLFELCEQGFQYRLGSSKPGFRRCCRLLVLRGVQAKPGRDLKH